MSTTFEAGEMVILENGAYSDLHWHGPFRVLKAFDIREAAETYKEESRTNDDATPYGFIAWLSTQGYTEDTPCRSVHVGSYGDVEIDE